MPRTLRTIGLVLVLATTLSAQPEKQPVSVDLLITNATIVTMDADRRIIENGQLAIRGDEIIYVGPAKNEIPFPNGIQFKETIDAHGKLLLPGFINAHTHVPMSLFRGLKDDVTLDEDLVVVRDLQGDTRKRSPDGADAQGRLPVERDRR